MNEFFFEENIFLYSNFLLDFIIIEMQYEKEEKEKSKRGRQ